jgi:UDP-glucose 4-epimerase
MKILITGGAGYIGRHLSMALYRNGHTITVLDDLSADPFSQNVNRHVNFIRGTVVDPNEVAVAALDVDVIFHLAGAYPDDYEERSHRAMETALLGTYNVMNEAFLSRRKPLVVFASSAAVYGSIKPGSRASETTRTFPISEYGLTKGMCEAMISRFGRDFAMRTLVARMFNVYGLGCHGVITKFARSAIKGEALGVYGDGEQVRNFVYIDDVVRFFSMVVDRAETNASVPALVNISDNYRGLSVNDIAQYFKDRFPCLNKRYHPDRPVGIRYSDGWNSVARLSMGWATSISLIEGIERTIEYEKNHSH